MAKGPTVFIGHARNSFPSHPYMGARRSLCKFSGKRAFAQCRNRRSKRTRMVTWP